jgi:hypothetical protein
MDLDLNPSSSASLRMVLGDNSGEYFLLIKGINEAKLDRVRGRNSGSSEALMVLGLWHCLISRQGGLVFVLQSLDLDYFWRKR